jgi:hypothetical protein
MYKFVSVLLNVSAFFWPSSGRYSRKKNTITAIYIVNCTFLCWILLWRWSENVETFGTTTCLYLIAYKRSAAVGIQTVSCVTTRNIGNLKKKFFFCPFEIAVCFELYVYKNNNNISSGACGCKAQDFSHAQINKTMLLPLERVRL